MFNKNHLFRQGIERNGEGREAVEALDAPAGCESGSGLKLDVKVVSTWMWKWTKGEFFLF